MFFFEKKTFKALNNAIRGVFFHILAYFTIIKKLTKINFLTQC